LPPGKWRYFTPAEMTIINSMVAGSSKTADGSEGMDE
jgi:23S rRNA pseudouridine2604 synthase